MGIYGSDGRDFRAKVKEKDELEKATRNSWKNLKSIQGWKTRITLNRVFTEEEFQKVSFGLIPKSMDDHWFIFLENKVLYFHRSWTGECVYRINFRQEENSYIPKEVWLSRIGWRSLIFSFLSKSFHRKLLLFLIETEFLGNNAPFPLPTLVEKILPNKYILMLNSEVEVENKD